MKQKVWTIQEASKYSGIPEQVLRCKMKAYEAGRNKVDIGFCERKPGSDRYSYYIFPLKFRAWLGEDVTPEGWESNRENPENRYGEKARAK